MAINNNYTITTDVNGTIVVQYGTVDTQQTSLSLVGKNAFGQGQATALNFVNLLQNFASGNQPMNPVIGQLWYQSALKKMYVYDGTAWINLSNAEGSDLFVLATDFYDSTGTSLYSTKVETNTILNSVVDQIAIARFEPPVQATYGNSTNQFIVEYTPAATQNLQVGSILYIIAPATNTGPVTLDSNGTPYPIVTMDNQPLVGGEILSNQIVGLRFGNNRYYLQETDRSRYVPTPPTTDASTRVPNTNWVKTVSQNIATTAVNNAWLPGEMKMWPGMMAPSGWLFCFGQALSRTTYAAMFANITTTLTGTYTSGATAITNLSADPTTLGVAAGMPISGPGITSGTLISSVTSTTISLSAATSAAGTNASVVIAPWGVGDGSTTFNVPDLRGRVPVGRDNMGGTAANRLTTAGSGIPGIRIGATGGTDSVTLSLSQLPSHSHTGTTASAGNHQHAVTAYTNVPSGQGYAIGSNDQDHFGSTETDFAGVHTHTFTTDTSGSSAAHNNVQPSAVVNWVIKT